MTDKFPLISILVLCYNNQHYIYENLKSIFEQTYPNIEVLIGDDESEDFDAEALIQWINKNRTGNIKHIAIYENEENQGTVANLEHLQNESEGEYLFQIAADDVLFDENVIQSFYDRAMELGDEGKYITAQTEMWDKDLEKKLEDFLKDEWIDLIKNGSARDVFGELSWHACLPACSFYRRDLIEKIGKLSDSYRLVEDWPWALRMTRMGIKPYFLEIQSSIKHRDGGISHGNTLQSKKAFLTYYRDVLKAYTMEVAPFRDLLTQKEYKRACKNHNDQIRAYYQIHLPEYLKQCKSAQQINIKPKQQIKTELKQTTKKIVLYEELKKIVSQFTSGRTILCTFATGLLTMITMFQATIAKCDECIRILLLWLSLILLSATAVEIILNILLRIRRLRRRVHDL